MRKIVLSLLLFPGVFVIAAALIRVIMSLEARPSALNINRWGVRETIAGIIAVNIPILRPILRASFWTPGPVTSQTSNSYTSSTQGKKTATSSLATSHHARPYMSYDVEKQDAPIKGGTAIELKDLASERSNDSGRSRTDSEEFIIEQAEPPYRHDDEDHDGVLVETHFESSVEYCRQSLRPAVPNGLNKEDSGYVANIRHSRRRR
jgi:hypothetical protein